MLQYYYLLYMKSQGTRPHDYRGHSRIRPRSGSLLYGIHMTRCGHWPVAYYIAV